MLTEAQIKDAAARLDRAEQTRTLMRQLTIEYPALALDEAYAIRRAFEEIETARRGPVAGFKIGLTTPIMQKLCGVDEPCYGAIFADEVHHGRAELSVGD